MTDAGRLIQLPPLANGHGIALPFRVIDAEYSDELERIVIVSTDPARLVVLDPARPAFRALSLPHRSHRLRTECLIVLDPADGSYESVMLPLAAKTVSVHPDGLRAAVGHDGWLSAVDLEAAALLDSYRASNDVLDVVFAPNDHAYAFPSRGGFTFVQSINMETGMEGGGGPMVYAGTVGRLHPAGDRIDGADRGLSPGDIHRYAWSVSFVGGGSATGSRLNMLRVRCVR